MEIHLDHPGYQDAGAQVAIYTPTTPPLTIPFIIISPTPLRTSCPVGFRATLSDRPEMLSNSIHPTKKLAITVDEVIELLRVFVLKIITCTAINLQDTPEVEYHYFLKRMLLINHSLIGLCSCFARKPLILLKLLQE